MSKTASLLVILFSLCTISACRSGVNKPQAGSNSGGTIDDVPLGADLAGGLRANDYTDLVCDNTTTHRGLRAWRRLSNIELVNTIRDIFGNLDGLDYSGLVNDIPKHEAFDTVGIKENYIDSNRLKGYFRLAESISAKADINTFFPCLAEGQKCINEQLADLALLIWRRPILEEESQRITALYQQAIAEEAGPEAAARLILQAMLVSPHFLYRSELGEQQSDGSYLLTDWELASALSYMLWRKPPDAELRQLAANGSLRQPEQLRSQASRMLNHPNAREAWNDFAGMWLDASRVLTVNREQANFTDQVKNSLNAEVKNFFIHTMFDAENSSYQQLLNSNYTIAGNELSWIYGSVADASGRLVFPNEQRRGILGQASFLAGHSFPTEPNPISRGVFIAERLLCVGFVPPPAVVVPEPQPGISNQERFRQHSVNPACASCHATIDPLGFAFENFDAVGVFRTEEAGLPININSQLKLDGTTISISSPQELTAAIADSHQGMECYVRQNFRYGLGRMEFAPKTIIGAPTEAKTSVQSDLDQCQINSLTSIMQANGGDLKAAILELISNPAFRIRLIGEPEAQ